MHSMTRGEKNKGIMVKENPDNVILKKKKKVTNVKAEEFVKMLKRVNIP